MVDVEGAGGSVTGDNSIEINDEITRLRNWYGNSHRVIGYWNPDPDAGLWISRPHGLNLVIPAYGRVPGDLSGKRNQAIVANEAFAHQFTSTATDQSPWRGQNVDQNWSPYPIDELLVLFGLVTSEGDDMAQVPQDQWDRVYQEITKKFPSRSPFRHLGEGVVDTWAGMGLNTDGSVHLQAVELLAVKYQDPGTVALLIEVASAADHPDKYPDRQHDAVLAARVLEDVSDEAIVAARERIAAWLEAEAAHK
jgi:hypothetical protein